MSYSNGTAANHTAFVTALVAFLTTDSGLTTEGHLWTKPWQNSDGTQFVMQGPGVPGGNPVYVGFRTLFNDVTSTYQLMIRGMTGISLGATDMSGHTGLSPEVAMFLDLEPMEYWFVANGRRVILVAKISTVYESAYAGFFLPYAIPVNYPNPIFVAGTHGAVDQDVTSWRSTYQTHTSFLWPSSGISSRGSTPSAWLMDPSSEWLALPDIGDQYTGVKNASMMPMRGGLYGSMFGENLNLNYAAVNGAVGLDTFVQRLGPNLDGGYSLLPLSPVSASNAGSSLNQTWGILDGAYAVPGFNNAAENTVTIGGLAHLVVQNIFRTTYSDYFAIQLG